MKFENGGYTTYTGAVGAGGMGGRIGIAQGATTKKKRFDHSRERDIFKNPDKG